MNEGNTVGLISRRSADDAVCVLISCDDDDSDFERITKFYAGDAVAFELAAE